MRRLRSSSIKSRGAAFLALLVCLFGLPAFGQPWDGNGVEGDPYLIYDACDMQAIGADANYWDAHFELMVDIDLSVYTGTSFNIIGDWGNPFTGVFDGNGHTISNFTYNSSGTSGIGVFGVVSGLNSEVRDVGLLNPNVDAGSGSTVGSLGGSFSHGTMSGCYAQGGVVSGAGSVGGLVGSSQYGATMQDCYSSSDVWSNGGAGGLAAVNWDATILDCHASGSVSGAGTEPQDEVGGLVGRTYGNISGCYASGAVSGQDVVGGLVGRSDAHAEDGDISNCYASGSVFGVRFVGGLVGGNVGGTVTNCHSVGPVSGTTYVGGLVGAGLEEYVLYSFWDVNRSNQVDSDGGVGKTTTQMQTATTFVEWLCEGYWTIDDGNDYPRLLWEDAPGLPLSGYLYAGGSGEANDPFLIETGEQLNRIGLSECSWTKHFRLIADVDLSAYTSDSFNIIGSYVGTDDPDNRPFTGVFDGDGHTISNFSYSSDGNDLVAIFAYVRGLNAEIKNLGLIDPNIDAGTGLGIGALAGWTDYRGTVRNCYVEGGSVSGGGSVGGLVGFNGYLGLITECYASSNVSGTDRIGGLVGGNSATISKSYSRGEVLGNTNVGGLVGNNIYGAWIGMGTTSNSYSEASVSGVENVGGLVGRNEGDISWCYSVGNVSGTLNVGGLAGWGGAVDSFWDVNSSGQASSSGGTPKTTAEMQTESTFTSAGWDFTTPVWTICEGEDYPRLAWEKYGGGNGTEANPYLIRTSCQMNAIGADSNDWDKHFKLMADIDLSAYTGTSFNIIGINPFTMGIAFTGVFDGNGHTISNFTYSSTGTDFIGLFGAVGYWSEEIGGDIKDLVLIDPNVNAGTGQSVGSLAGHLLNGSVRGCSVEGGYVSGGDGVGGLVGRIRFIEEFWSGSIRISSCSATGVVKGDIGVGGLIGRGAGNGTIISNCSAGGTVEAYGHVGGLMGVHYGESMISDCYSEADVIGSLEPEYDHLEICIGGLVGSNAETGVWGGLIPTISNSHSLGSVSGRDKVGGLVGSNSGTISNCGASCRVVGIGLYIGGLVGGGVGDLVGGGGTISGSYATGDVEGDMYVGGLLGSGSNVSNSYSLGAVSGDSDVGGLVGEDASGTISNCYSAGSVSGNVFIGGLVGFHHSGGSYSSCFWDSDVAPDVNGIGKGSDPNVISESTANMQTASTFTDAGWDFVGEVINGPNDIWDICEGTNYPKFVWQIPAADFVCPDGVNFIDYAFFAKHWLQSIYGECGGVELTGDGKVNWVDFALFSEYWKLTGCGECGGADFTGDENVDLADLYVFATYWLGFEYAEVDLTNDGQVGLDDLREFTENWLAGM